MAYARIDENSRILEWSYEHLDGMDAEFSNGEYIDATATHGLEDFVIRDGVAYFEPTPEKLAAIESEITLEKLDAQHDEYAIETDAALFDLDAAQIGYEADTDAALFDLVDYISSLEARIEQLEASND